LPSRVQDIFDVPDEDGARGLAEVRVELRREGARRTPGHVAMTAFPVEVADAWWVKDEVGVRRFVSRLSVGQRADHPGAAPESGDVGLASLAPTKSANA
jgi:hypothetical protein